MNEKLEDQLRGAIRLKHYSLRTEEAYVGWYRRFVLLPRSQVSLGNAVSAKFHFAGRSGDEAQLRGKARS